MTVTASAPATPAPAASTSAQPAAVARTTPAAAPKADATDLNRNDAVKFLAERRKLRLVDESDKPAIDDDVTNVDPTADTSDDADKTETETDEAEDPAAQATWAQKLRKDLADKTERIKAIEDEQAQRESTWTEAVQQAKHAREDLADEAAFHQSYATALEAVIEEAANRLRAAGLLGKDQPLLDPLSKQLFMKGRDEAKLKRQLERAQHGTKAQQTEKVGAKAVETLNDLRKRIPELDWEKVPEAKQWLAQRFAKDEQGRPTGLGMKNLEADAMAFAKALRWDRSQKQTTQRNTQQTQRPGEEQRPSSTTMAGASQGGSVKPTPKEPQNAKESLAWIQSRKAARK